MKSRIDKKIDKNNKKKKTTRIRVGTLLILVGITILTYATVLFVQNQIAEQKAKDYSDSIVEQIYKVSEDAEDDTLSGEESDNESTIPSPYEREILIEGNLYIGVLSIPSLGLELAIQSEWSYEKLKNTPCVYSSEPFSIAAHNYSTHFGKIGTLVEGDLVHFTSITGDVYEYEVLYVTKIYETQIELLQDESYDLSLFTCNVSNNSERIVVRLKCNTTIYSPI